MGGWNPGARSELNGGFQCGFADLRIDVGQCHEDEIERAGIVVQRHDQHVRLLSRRFEVANVPDVEQVEAAVGEGHGAAGGAIGRYLIKKVGAGKHSTHR